MKSQSFNDLKVTLNNCVNILDNVGIDTLNVLHDELQYVVKYAIQCEDEINNIKLPNNTVKSQLLSICDSVKQLDTYSVTDLIHKLSYVTKRINVIKL
jgi:hypothetical protein